MRRHVGLPQTQHRLLAARQRVRAHPQRLKAGAVLIDIGCGLAQDLRRMVALGELTIDRRLLSPR